MLRNFSPAAIQKRIARVSVFLAGWEILRFEIEDRLRDFYLAKPNLSQRERQTAYQREVLTNGQPRFEASLLWLCHTGALSDADVAAAQRLKAYRREVARLLPRLLLGSDASLDVTHVADMKNLLNKLTAYWSNVNSAQSDRRRSASRDHELASIMDKLAGVADRDHLIR